MALSTSLVYGSEFGFAGLNERGNRRRLRGDLAQDFDPLGPERGAHEADAGHVAAGFAEARDEAGLHRIGVAHDEHDRNFSGRRLCGLCCQAAAAGGNDIHPALHQVARERHQPFGTAFREAKDDRKVLPFDEPRFAQALGEGTPQVLDRYGGMEETNDAHRSQLRACGDRPRRREPR